MERAMRANKIIYLHAVLLCVMFNFLLLQAENEELKLKIGLSAHLKNISKNANILPIRRSTTVPTSSTTTVAPTTKKRLKNERRSVKEHNDTVSTTTTEPVKRLDSESSGGNEEISTTPIPPTATTLTTTRSPLAKISGIDRGGKRRPEDLIRTALINHTLEHGGEQDLDKLVFSNLPNGSKLVLRTVKIIKTDGEGNPMDDSENEQPTYWDVTLANATGSQDTDDGLEDDDDESESEESEEEEDNAGNEDSVEGREIASPLAAASTTQPFGVNPLIANRIRPKKRPDLDSSGSHSRADYRHLNDYVSTGRGKETEKTNFHGNTHGNSLKNTYTVTDGKEVKPYHGTEKGWNDNANSHGKENKDQGERFKTHKRKNKGRKVTGFKRVYHKEEYQRTEHFYDDEEAKRIAESFGLTEAKEGTKQESKGDKRDYNGVRTDYLDGKKHENERGTHDGYHKGQQTSHKNTEKHNQLTNYGKSQSQSYGSHPQQQQQSYDYHPNHNYHGSYSNPSKATVPKSVADKLVGGGGGGPRSIAAIISAPMAHSFSLTEYAPLGSESITTPDPRKVALTYEYPKSSFDMGNYTANPLQAFKNNTRTFEDDDETTDDDDNEDSAEDENESNNETGYEESYKPKYPGAGKVPREKKVFYSPKHRVIKDDDDIPANINDQLLNGLTATPKKPTPVTYQVASVIDILDTSKDGGEVVGEKATINTPFAPNFAPTRDSQGGQYLEVTPQHYAGETTGPRYHKTWRWQRRRPKIPAVPYSPLPVLSPKGVAYPHVMQQMHLAAIPFRHASAFNRLGNRHNLYTTIKQHPKLRYPYEVSTRRSDSVEYDYENGTSPYSSEENNSAHYFNHDHRYAKYHMTSTINPLPSNEGVRNTLIESNPLSYSTYIKVLPATILNVNDSIADQQHISSNSHKVPATKRPLSHADSISITTPYPQHISAASQQHQVRPFLPKNRWLTLAFNLGNPDFKLSSEYGPSQHPFNHNSEKASHLLQSLKKGILKPFGRSIPSSSHQSIHNQRHHNPAYAHTQPLLIRRQPYRKYHPIFAHNMVSYENFDKEQEAEPSSLVSSQPSSSPKSTPSQMSASSPAAGKSKRPLFYYNPSRKANTSFSITDGSPRKPLENKVKTNVTYILYKPTLKVAKTSTSLSVTPSTTTTQPSTSTQPVSTPVSRIGEAAGSEAPPFLNSIMDSVAGFFGTSGKR